jgi:RNA polymerase sigma factor (TIGR02999 family)
MDMRRGLVAPAAAELTVLLRQAAAGDNEVREPLYRLLYPELSRLSRRHLARAGTISLDASAVLHEAYLRMTDRQDLPITNRHVFFAYASRVMRSVVVDHVRERGAAKRGGGVQHLTLGGVASSIFREHSVTDIDRALSALERADERAFRVVEMRYFAGLKEDEIAAVLGVSLATVRRDWRKARALLYDWLR